MKNRTSLRNLILLSILSGAFFAFTFRLSGGDHFINSVYPKLNLIINKTTDLTPIPTNLGVTEETNIAQLQKCPCWMININVFSNKPPKIEKIVKVSNGKATPSRQGEGEVLLVDDNGSVLYQISFFPIYLRGDPPRKVDEVQIMVIVPSITGGKNVRVITSQGSAELQIP